jgi:tetratricopeptide (TPR) repeat protein/DNA-binding winged helix-turn-helix (wHTH) protein
MAPTRYRIRNADLEVRPDLGCLRCPDGQEIYLRPKSFQTLLLLLQNRHRVVTKDDIVREVWPDTATTDDAIVQCIVELRKVLGDDAKQARYIRTLPKSGYRFVGDVEIDEASEATVQAAAQVNAELADEVHAVRADTSPYPVGARTPSMFVPATIVIVVLLLIGTSVALSVRSAPADPSAGVLDAIAREGDHRTTIAVMVLQNQSKTAELEWLSEGLADMLVTGLSRSKTLAVVGRQQLELLLDRVGHPRGAPVDFAQAMEVARRARLDHFVVGSFAKLGDTIRIDLRLHDGTGRLVRTEALTIDSPNDLLKQVDLLGWRLAQQFGEPSSDVSAATGAVTNNLEAYRNYSTGISKGEAFRTEEAIQAYTRATELDPEFAMAFARIGYVYGVTGTQIERARPFLAKAYSLQHRLSEKDRLQVEAWNALVHLDYAAAAGPLAKLIRAYPMDVESYSRLGVILAGEHRYDEAVDVLRRGLAVDPEAAELWNRLGGIYDVMHRHDDAIAARQKYVALLPNEANSYDSLGSSFQAAGRYDVALTAYRRAIELNPRFDVTLIHLGHTYYQLGRFADAEAAYRRYLAVVKTDRELERGYDNLALLARRRGRFREALDLIRKPPSPEPREPRGTFEAIIRVDAGESPDRILAQLAPVAAAPNRGSRMSDRRRQYLLGVLAMKKGENEQALEHFRGAIRESTLFADADPLEDALANAYLKLNRLDEAIAEYQRVLGLNPHYPLARYHLAVALEKKGEAQQARKAYQEFLTEWAGADADVPEIVSAKARLASMP